MRKKGFLRSMLLLWTMWCLYIPCGDTYFDFSEKRMKMVHGCQQIRPNSACWRRRIFHFSRKSIFISGKTQQHWHKHNTTAMVCAHIEIPITHNNPSRTHSMNAIHSQSEKIVNLTGTPQATTHSAMNRLFNVHKYRRR